MSEIHNGQEEQNEGARLLRYSNPIRDAIFEATYGDMDTAFAIARGEVIPVHQEGGEA